MPIDFPEFKPQWFCRNSHLQTILSVYVPTRFKTSEGIARRVTTPDDDTIVVRENTPEKWRNGDRVVILTHGLCGSHRSQYMIRLSSKLLDQGFKTIRIDMRGFGDSESVSRGHMHAGRSDDVKSVLEDAMSRYPNSPVTLIGFSLGANITLKLLCEYGESPPSLLDSTVAVSPPIDLLKCTLNLRKGFNRFYDRYFAQLVAGAVKRRRQGGMDFDDLPIDSFPNRLFDFDDQYTAPVSGFENAEDYYRQCSTHQLLDQISIPTLLLVARNDPIVPFDMYHDIVAPKITKLFADGGGHLGFISRKTSDSDKRWMDWRITEWVGAIDQGL